MATKKTASRKTARPATTRKKATKKTKKTVASTPHKPTRPPSAANNGAGILVRMYRVGFGDFFLLSVRGGDGSLKHVLIDCGVHAGDLNSIGAAVDHLAADTGMQLALVIMTHRHADHISGFARAKDVFAKFNVEMVWMPWFEDPANKTAQSFQASLTALAGKLEQQLALRAAPDDGMYRDMMTNITGSNLTGGSNDTALAVLHGGFKNPAPVLYYKAGDTPKLPNSLTAASVGAKILGPPTDLDLIAQMDSKQHQYLSVSLTDPAGGTIRPFSAAFRATPKDYPERAFSLFNPTMLEKTILDAQPDMLAARVQRADNTINNQSLVVLFEIAGKKLLFSGDAQWGNWANFLFGGAVTAGKVPQLTAEAKAILADIDFYKVGHHGSTNATPIDALQAMRSGMVGMCSTEPDCYGNEKNNSEVPRKPLIAQLQAKTGNKLALSTEVKVEGKAADGSPPAIFEVPEGKDFIDYNF